MKMRILINASNIRVAGGVTVVYNFLNELQNNYKQHDFLIIGTDAVSYQQFCTSNIEVKTFSDKLSGWFFRIYVETFILRTTIEQWKPDVIFTMGNLGLKTKLPQATLFMLPWAIYPEFNRVWQLLSFKERLIYRLRNILVGKRFKYASIVLPQTKVSETRLLSQYKYIKKINVVPMAYSKIGLKSDFDFKLKKEAGKHYLLCLTKYYVHKNIEIILECAKIVKKQNLNIVFVITIETNQHENAQLLLDQIKSFELDKIIINIGSVKFESVPALFNNCDALFMPTLLESFSATYVDAMFFQKPIFTSNLDFAHEICSDAAIYFDPFNATDIINKIEKTLSNPIYISQLVKNGTTRINTFPDWSKVAGLYISELEMLKTHF
jgi:glycosyltransferase involved in cell wall biosynthesis